MKRAGERTVKQLSIIIAEVSVKLHSFLDKPLLELGEVIEACLDYPVECQAVDVAAGSFQSCFDLFGRYSAAILLRRQICAHEPVSSTSSAGIAPLYSSGGRYVLMSLCIR